MAGKCNRKALEVGKDDRKALWQHASDLFSERLAYDILSITLPLCGIPKEMLKSKERKENIQDDEYFEYKICFTTLNFALSKRDEWKIMFESRFKSAGIGMRENINDFLKTLLTISRVFQNSNTMNKVAISLAAYTEMILFLNHKGIEFDFELIIVSWKNLLNEFIAPHAKKNEPLQDLFQWPNEPVAFFKTLTEFGLKFAVPYGRRNDVSEAYRHTFNELIKIDSNYTSERARRKHFASQKASAAAADDSDPILPQGFESPADLPGDRDSPEPTEKRRGPRVKYFKPVWPRDFVPLSILPDKIKSPEQPEDLFIQSGVRGKEKESRIETAKPVEPHGLESVAVLSDKNINLGPPKSCVTESGGSGKDKESSVLMPFTPQTTNAAAAGETDPILPSGFESLAAFSGDRESSEQPEDSSIKSGVRRKDKKSKIQSARRVEPHGLKSVGDLPDKTKSPEPPESCVSESGGSGKGEESSIQSTRPKDVTVRRRRPTVEQALSDSFKQIKLDSSQEKQND